MIWITGAALAFVFMKFGGLLVTVKLLAVGLVCALLLNVALAFGLIWKTGVLGRLVRKDEK